MYLDLIGHVLIPLRTRKGDIRAYAVVDRQDAEIARMGWYLAGKPGRKYVQGKNDVYLHRTILGLKPGDPWVDHINGNRLDNRRANLRLVDAKQSTHNVASRGGRSQYRGVTQIYNGRWRAYAKVDGQRQHLGYFDDEAEAAKAASDFRRIHMTHTNEDRHPVEGGS